MSLTVHSSEILFVDDLPPHSGSQSSDSVTIVILTFVRSHVILGQRCMTPYLYTNRRATRFLLAERTPVVLQFPDSHILQCELNTISRTGGLLSVPCVVDAGSQATLMFRTHKGLLFANVEMLLASTTYQAFRFTDLREQDKSRLLSAFQSELFRNIREEELIEEFRSATATWDPPRRKNLVRPVLAVGTIAALCSSLIYIVGAHLR